MKYVSGILLSVIFLWAASSCRSTKKLHTAIAKKDTTTHHVPVSSADSINRLSKAQSLLDSLKADTIVFNTFYAKAKVEYEDHNGKQPDFNAFIRLKKDSVLWISVSATFLGIEGFRVYITPDTIAILNKLDKTIEYHPFNYIEDMIHIPMNFSILQNIILGKPVYLGDSIVSYNQTSSQRTISTINSLFKNLLTVSADNHLTTIKLDDINVNQNRTASLLYDNYDATNKIDFSTYREISVSEKSKVDIRINFKQYEFNKELSYPFSVPRNYKTK